MITIEIPPNPNCEAVDLRIFHDLEPPRGVNQVRLERHGSPQWYRVTGWTLQGSSCPALGRKVDDSGEGVVLLVSGGEAGLRAQPADRRDPWRLDYPEQWGAPFLLLADAQDVRFDDEPQTLS